MICYKSLNQCPYHSPDKTVKMAKMTTPRIPMQPPIFNKHFDSEQLPIHPTNVSSSANLKISLRWENDKQKLYFGIFRISFRREKGKLDPDLPLGE